MVRNQAKQVLVNVIEDVRLGQSIKTDEAQKAVNSIVDSLMEDKDALLCLSQLKSRDQYTVFHSLNVLILSVAFGRQLGLGVDDLQMVGLGGLLHDSGKMKIPLEILNKPGKLTDSEFALVKNHVRLGKELLEKSGDFPKKALNFILQHHERYNGIRIPSLVEHFIKTIGIYPTGSIVEINHSDVGIVVSNNEENVLKPSVLLLFDKQKTKYQPPRLIDLKEKLPDFNTPLWSVSKVLGPFKEELLGSLSGK